MPTDPAPFLSTIALASAGLVAIVGGLLVARFVSLDSEQRGSRKVLADATERLESARRRAKDARADVLDWHARRFFRGRMLDAVSKGTSDPAALMRVGDWPFAENDLRPFAADLAREFARARTELNGRGSAVDGFGGLDAWEQFRHATPDLPEIHWDRAWQHVFEAISVQRAMEREAARRQAPRRSDPLGMDRLAEQMSDPRYLRNIVATAPARTDHGVIAARREDELEAAEVRAQQRVEDYEAELSRLRQAHLEIVRPDARLWWGVIILTAYAVVGVALPMWEMSSGPDDLGQVSWIFYLFAAGLAALIIYIIVYLVQLTRTTQDSLPPGDRLSWPDRLMRAFYTSEWHPRGRVSRTKTWP